MSGPLYYCPRCTDGKCLNVIMERCTADRKCKHNCANMARYSHNQVSNAVNEGVDLITHDSGIYLSDKDHDLINLVVNAVLFTVSNPGATLDDVITSSYSAEIDEVRSWLD